jgi:hypothetical protein
MRRVFHAGASRRRIARSLNAAYAGGLLSQDTFVARLDQLFRSRVVEPFDLVGDLTLRERSRTTTSVRIRELVSSLLAAMPQHSSHRDPAETLLALDWSGETRELLVGRHTACDVVVRGDTVSRQHARLVFRDGKWIIHDLRSTNGTAVNGTYVGRCELCPGDQLVLGEECFAID